MDFRFDVIKSWLGWVGPALANALNKFSTEMVQAAIVDIARPILDKFGRVKKAFVPRKIVLAQYHRRQDAERALRRFYRYVRANPNMRRRLSTGELDLPRHIRWNAQLAQSQIKGNLA